MRSTLVKYGRSAFKKEIIKTFKNRKAALKEEEKLVTREFINRDDNFNHRTGGTGNVEFSEEVRQKFQKIIQCIEQMFEKKFQMLKRKYGLLKKSKNCPKTIQCMILK